MTNIPDSRLQLHWHRSTMMGPLGSRGAIILGSIGILLLMGGLLLRQRTRLADVLRPEAPRQEQPQQADARPPAQTPRPTPEASPRKVASKSRPPPKVEQEPDLPDWLLDGDTESDKAGMPSFDEIEEAASSSNLSELPDTLALDEADRETAEPEPEPMQAEQPPESPRSTDGSSQASARTVDETLVDPPERELTLESFASSDTLDEDLGRIEDDFAQVLEPADETPSVREKGDAATEVTRAPTPAKPDRPPIIPRELFRADEILGVVEDSMDARCATLIGQAIGTEAAARGIGSMVVARDGRLYGAVLLSALSQGLRSAGIDVIEIGAVPTPVLYFAASELAAGSAVMVTGSHHPPQYNGFKVLLGGELLHGDALSGLFDRIQSQEFSSGSGALEEREVVNQYLERIGSDIQLERPLKVVVDCGNGVAGLVAPQLLSSIGADVIPLYADVDGNFPNHQPDPANPDNLEDLRLCVRNFQADLGLAFDGDGDRLAVLSASGGIVWPDQLMMLFVGGVLANNPGAAVVFDSRCSAHLAKLVEQAGGKPVMVASGHGSIRSALVEHSAPLGGEFSGHLFFKDRWLGFDDALYAGARVLELLAADTRKPADLIAELPVATSTPELRVELEEGQARSLIDRLRKQGDFGEARVSHVDGLRAEYPDGWGLVRPARSSAALMLRFEGDDAKAMTRIKNQFKSQLKALDPSLNLPF